MPAFRLRMIAGQLKSAATRQKFSWGHDIFLPPTLQEKHSIFFVFPCILRRLRNPWEDGGETEGLFMILAITKCSSSSFSVDRRPTAVPFHVRSILFLPRGAAAAAAAGAPKERLEKREEGTVVGVGAGRFSRRQSAREYGRKRFPVLAQREKVLTSHPCSR